MDKKEEAWEKWKEENKQWLEEAIINHTLTTKQQIDFAEIVFSNGFEAGKHYTVTFLKGRIKPSKHIKG